MQTSQVFPLALWLYYIIIALVAIGRYWWVTLQPQYWSSSYVNVLGTFRKAPWHKRGCSLALGIKAANQPNFFKLLTINLNWTAGENCSLPMWTGEEPWLLAFGFVQLISGKLMMSFMAGERKASKLLGPSPKWHLIKHRWQVALEELQRR